MYLLGKYYNSLIARERKQLRLWKYFSFFNPHDTISISCFVLKQFSVSKAFQPIDIFFPLSKLLTQLSSMLTRSQCWQKLPSSRPPPICPPHAGMTQRVTRPSSSPITIDFTKQQSIRQYPGGVMVRVGG